MLYVYPFLLSLIYWVLDSYYAMQAFNISFFEAFIFDYPQATAWIRVIITLGILGALFFHKKKDVFTKQDALQEADRVLKNIHKVSEITLSTLSIQKRLNEAAKLLQEDLPNCQSVFIGTFEKDSILILNTNEFLAHTGIKKQYFPYQEGIKENSLEEFLSLCYIEKREWMDKKVIIRDIQYRAITYLYMQKRTKKPLGIFGFLCKEEDTRDYSQLIEQAANQIFFSMELERKKSEALESQNLFTEQIISNDKMLHIANINKVQEFLGQEIKRSQRYETELTLILISIDYLQNLSNVFSDKEILMLKQEFIKLFKNNIRDTDLFGKWADDTFVIVAPNIDFRAARGFIKKLNDLLKEHRFAKVGKITCSYGVTSFSSTDSIGEFRKRAESALSQALEQGRDSIEVKLV